MQQQQQEQWIGPPAIPREPAGAKQWRGDAAGELGAWRKTMSPPSEHAEMIAAAEAGFDVAANLALVNHGHVAGETDVGPRHAPARRIPPTIRRGTTK